MAATHSRGSLKGLLSLLSAGFAAIAFALCVLVTGALGPAARAPSPSASGTWWKHAVVYEIYPRSFQDSNGDGIGDLNGITSRLDYLRDLGIDAIWITPMYPSPQVDFGYDISDYEAVDPQYGTLADMDRLIAEAKKRNIRVTSRHGAQPYLRQASVVHRRCQLPH